MKRLVCGCLAVLLIGLTGCSGVRQTSASASPEVTVKASPTPTATPEAEETDPVETDEADYYFDFGQDDRIRLNYTVEYPSAAMSEEGWEETESTRVSALLTLIGESGEISVRLEDAPECADLSEFAAQAEQLAGYTYEGASFTREETENRITLSAEVPDGRSVRIVLGETDGLYSTMELCVSGEKSEEAIRLFEETFVPQVTFRYQEIETLGGETEEEG